MCIVLLLFISVFFHPYLYSIYIICHQFSQEKIDDLLAHRRNSYYILLLHNPPLSSIGFGAEAKNSKESSK
ncbi:hypothetical protein EBB54_02895 [Schaedlerella arabinosiphila]|uniref:Uncharacterized protein n=1 Tax=Schaedlerella arabinosiphila TaxID=2044587 RepID=A0A426DCG5_9FIRM|nr:hypothetical protein EBB54_02895 [Schaedlerella arabinosiphila]